MAFSSAKQLSPPLFPQSVSSTPQLKVDYGPGEGSLPTLEDNPLVPPPSQPPCTSSRMVGDQFPHKGGASPSGAAEGPQWTEDSWTLPSPYNPVPHPTHPQQNRKSGRSSGAYQRGLGATGSGDKVGPAYLYIQGTRAQRQNSDVSPPRKFTQERH